MLLDKLDDVIHYGFTTAFFSVLWHVLGVLLYTAFNSFMISHLFGMHEEILTNLLVINI